MRSKLFALRIIFYVKLIFILVFFCIGVALHAQNVQPQPKVDIRVNKQFDDKGNLVRYDSVYTWSHTSGHIPAHGAKGEPGHSHLHKYTDSLWRSMLQPADLLFIDKATWQLMQNMQQTLKQLPQQNQKQQNQKQHLPNRETGRKKPPAKAAPVITI